MEPIDYDVWKSFKKGLVPAVVIFLTSQISTLDLDGLLADPKRALPALGLSLLVGCLKFVHNMWKNRDLPGNPFYTPPKLPPYAGLVVFMTILSLGLSGCLTTPPGLGGKTKYSMQFQDTVDQIKDDAGTVIAPGQDTSFGVTIAAPAGVDVKDLASMRYRVNPDTGEVDISVASDTAADTTVQAQAIVQAHQMSLETIKVLTPVLTEAISNALLPLPTGTGTTDPPGRRAVNMPRLLSGLQSIGVNITVEQAELLAELLGLDVAY